MESQTKVSKKEAMYQRIKKHGEDLNRIFNFDPRGYALKIKDDYIRNNNIKICQDWGGYGIIAPDLT